MDAEGSVDYDAIQVREDTYFAIPQRFRWAKFGSAKLKERVKPASAIAKADAATALPIVLIGKGGCGKTTLGCALLRKFADRLGKPGVFADAIELAYARKLHRLGDGEAPEVLEAMRAGILFLDELGAEHGIDQSIDEIVRVRHNHDRPTIVGSPHTPERLRERYGDGVSRRIFEGATIIRLGAA